MSRSSEDAQHDRADEGKGDICRYNAQSACESHGKVPFFHVAVRIEQNQIANRRLPKKSAPLSMRRKSPARDVVKRK
jgi:hypothetical protein